MNYYQHHIGDYRSDTGHLTPTEHGIYRQLLDWYYHDERPIPSETDFVMRRLSATTQKDKTAVKTVLKEFFFATEEGYNHKRCEQELEKYRSRVGNAKANGIKGGRPKGSKDLKPKKPRETESVSFSNPEKPSGKLTKENPPTPLKGGGAGSDVDASRSRSEPSADSGKSSGKHRASRSKSVPEGFDEFYADYPRKEARRDAEQAWRKLAPDEPLRRQIHAALTAQKTSQRWLKDNGSYIPLPASWLNGRRWEDQLLSGSEPADSWKSRMRAAL